MLESSRKVRLSMSPAYWMSTTVCYAHTREEMRKKTADKMVIRSKVVQTDRTNDTELRSSRFRSRWKALAKLGFRDFLVLRYGGFYIRAHAARAPAVNLGRKKSHLDDEKGPGRLEGAIFSLNLRGHLSVFVFRSTRPAYWMSTTVC